MSKNSAANSSQNDPLKKAFRVYNFIVSKGGEINFLELIKHPSPLKSLTEEEATEWLKQFNDLNDKEDVIEKPCFIFGTNNEGVPTVRALIKARLCFNYEKNGSCKHGSDCLQFHVCKGFLEGRCTDSGLCSRSHDFFDKENVNKIRKYRLQHLGNTSFRNVIRRNLPFVCEDYVNNVCTNPFCQHLHVCSRLVKNICEDKEERCPLRRSHDLQSPHNKRVIRYFSVPVKYLLCNVLVSKNTKLEVEKEEKRKGKVNKLNNLNNIDDDEKQGGEFSKCGALPQNIMPNVSETPSPKGQKGKGKQKKEFHSYDPNVKPQGLNIKPGLLPTPSFNEKLQQRQADAGKSFSLPPSSRERSSQPSPLMGVPLDIPSEYIRDTSRTECNVIPQGLNVRPGLFPTPSFDRRLQQRQADAGKGFSLPPSSRERSSQPAPLMGVPLDIPAEHIRQDFKEKFQNMLFPQDFESRDQSTRGRLEQKRGGLARGGRKWKSMDHFQTPPPSGQFSLGNQEVDDGRGDITGGDAIRGRGARGVRGRGSWRGRGRGTTLYESEIAPQNESLSAGFSKEENASSATAKEAGKRRRRQRYRKRKGSSDSHSNMANLEGEEEVDEAEEVREELMSFNIEEEEEDDLIDLTESSDLVDLTFDSDPGLSQASEGQALWEMFSQDQLYESLQDKDLDSTSELSDSYQSTQPSNLLVASERAVFNCIVKEFGGAVSFSEISTKADLFPPDFEEHEKWFLDHPSSFLINYTPKGQVAEIKAIALGAKMCFKYCGKGCNGKKCPFFHVCKEYIAKGKCDVGDSCKKNHGFSDNHNKHIASKLFPKEHFTDEQLQCVVQSSTPQVCMDYNNGRCRTGARLCTKIHICKNYGKKRCPKGSCNLAHNNGLGTPSTKKILRRFKIKGPPDVNGFIVAKTLLVCDDKPDDVSDGDATPSCDMTPALQENKVTKSDSTEASSSYHISSNLCSHICLKFLLNRCKKGAKCKDHHCLMPYQWVYMAKNKWHMLNGNENLNLERFFCNENLTDAMITLTLDCSSSSSSAQAHQNESYIYSVDFNQMQVSQLDEEESHYPIKRLSTESEVHIPDCQLATKWQWFWKDPSGKFTEYQPSQGSKDPTSASIERHFLEGHSTYDFHVESHDYRLYFRKKPMVQKNMDPKYYTMRDVCRRPRYVSKQEFEKIRSNTHKLPIEDSREMPHLWTKMAECQEFLLFPLKNHSKEFKEMETMFLNSIRDKKVTINSIDRVQNPFMMEKYIRKKNHMQKRASASSSVDERFLFHGTSHRNIRPICKQNFDWRLYGEVTGNIYGEGAYFARDSYTSDCYCPEDEDGLRYIFIAKVLIGSYAKGEKKYKRPPPKDANDPHDLHDSCVDNIHSPKIFVVFDVDQYYPAYLIEYKHQDLEYYSSYGTSGTTVPKRQVQPTPSSTSYSYTGSNLPPSHYSPAPSSPTSPSYLVTGPNQAMTSPPPRVDPSTLVNAMEKQWEDFSYSSSSKKSSQDKCLVM